MRSGGEDSGSGGGASETSLENLFMSEIGEDSEVNVCDAFDDERDERADNERGRDFHCIVLALIEIEVICRTTKRRCFSAPKTLRTYRERN